MAPDTNGTKTWIDFNKLIHALECVKIYLKDHRNRLNIFISNEYEQVQPEEPVKPPPKKSKTTKKPTVELVPKKEPEAPANKTLRVYGDDMIYLYMFVDQEEHQDAFLDLTVVKDERHMIESRIKLDKYLWNCPKQQVAIELETSSMMGKVFALPAGRSVYRIKCKARNFCFHIKTNSQNIQITDEDKLFDLMAADGVRFEKYVQNIVKNMKDYIESVGNSDFVANMVYFFGSFEKYMKQPYNILQEIHTFFMNRLQESIINYLRELGDFEGIRTLRRFWIIRGISILSFSSLTFEKRGKHYKNIYLWLIWLSVSLSNLVASVSSLCLHRYCNLTQHKLS